jgi:hypothetical protein
MQMEVMVREDISSFSMGPQTLWITDWNKSNICFDISNMDNKILLV